VAATSKGERSIEKYAVAEAREKDERSTIEEATTNKRAEHMRL
jgi:hypothetical protein